MSATADGGAILAGGNPFSRMAVLTIVLLGAGLFVALLWLIGAGNNFGSTNDGQAHAGGRGLNGYAALAEYLDNRGFAVSRQRDNAGADTPGLLILTPPPGVEVKDLDRMVSGRRRIGPTMIVVPKWHAVPARGPREKQARPGWVRLAGVGDVQWRGFHDEIELISSEVKGRPAPMRWVGAGLSAPLPAPAHVLGGRGDGVVPLVRTQDGKLTLAAVIEDGGDYPGLADLAGRPLAASDRGEGLYPLVFVFEPDLIDNYGMAHLENARLAEALVRAMGVAPGGQVAFDLTLNGHGGEQNLLTLAFRPPFLAATLCLLLAGVIVGWRAFMRFGPPHAADRAIAFGKRALVANTAGLIRRSRRYRLLGAPYADRGRERLAAALALPRGIDPLQTERAIDRALAARSTDHPTFTETAARLRAARKAPDLVRAARDLHALERILTR